MKKGKLTVTAEMFDDDGGSEIRLNVDQKTVSIPVTAAVKAYFNEQFKTNTPTQKKRRTTMMNILRDAYKKGLQDARPQ